MSEKQKHATAYWKENLRYLVIFMEQRAQIINIFN